MCRAGKNLSELEQATVKSSEPLSCLTKCMRDQTALQSLRPRLGEARAQHRYPLDRYQEKVLANMGGRRSVIKRAGALLRQASSAQVSCSNSTGQQALPIFNLRASDAIGQRYLSTLSRSILSAPSLTTSFQDDARPLQGHNDICCGTFTSCMLALMHNIRMITIGSQALQIAQGRQHATV